MEGKEIEEAKKKISSSRQNIMWILFIRGGGQGEKIKKASTSFPVVFMEQVERICQLFPSFQWKIEIIFTFTML